MSGSFKWPSSSVMIMVAASKVDHSSVGYWDNICHWNQDNSNVKLDTLPHGNTREILYLDRHGNEVDICTVYFQDGLF